VRRYLRAGNRRKVVVDCEEGSPLARVREMASIVWIDFKKISWIISFHLGPVGQGLGISLTSLGY
jgi:hypothetical protein